MAAPTMCSRNGQRDLVPDYKEQSRGAYAVANFNDTNGDDVPDAAQHPVTPGLDPRGYNEYDLMKLVINPPDPVVYGFDTIAPRIK